MLGKLPDNLLPTTSRYLTPCTPVKHVILLFEAVLLCYVIHWPNDSIVTLLLHHFQQDMKLRARGSTCCRNHRVQ
jgi:hypothetical protein